MTKLSVFEAIIEKAKEGGYEGPSAEYELGKIVTGTNVYAIIFREDFAKALWGEKITIWELAEQEIPNWKRALRLLIDAEDKWKYLEENAL